MDDSLGAVEFRQQLTASLGVELPVTAAFDYPSVAALAGFLGSQDGGALGRCIDNEF